MKYYLTQSNLSPQGNKYKGNIKTTGTCNREELIERMLDRGTLLTKTDIVAALNSLEETIMQLVSEGKNINLPLFNIGYSIAGDFDSATDTYDHKRHRVKVNINRGVLLRDAHKVVSMHKTEYTPMLPHIKSVKDLTTETLNSQITPKGVITLIGANIKIDGDNSECGIYFIHESGSTIKAQTIVHNSLSRVILQAPELQAGKYTIKIITQHAGTHIYKTPLCGTFAGTLVVE